MFVTNWNSTTKIQKISEITNFFRHYFLSRTEVVRNTIKRIFKQGVLKEFEAAKYITLDNGNKADVYSMEMVMAIAFQLDTSWAQIFRKWMVERVVNKEKVEREWQKTEHPMIVMMNNSKDFN